MTIRRAAGTLALMLLATNAGAQTRSEVAGRRVAFDTVVGVQDYFREDRDWPMQIVFDAFVSAEPRPHWQVSFRPKYWRTNGVWDTYLDQASIQFDFKKGSSWRIEAGRFPSPIGYGLTENRPSLNAGAIWWHRPYYMPLPKLGANLPQASLIATVYPDGVQVATSGTHWDARGAVVDEAPVSFWYGDALSSHGPQVIVGGGVTPMQGLRVGVGAARGTFAKTQPDGTRPRYSLMNVEAEWSVGYTKVSGEWVSDRFSIATGRVGTHGWTAQAQRTITPRLFAHSRMTFIDSPDGSVPGTFVRRQFRSFDTTVGYRLDPDFTLRVSHAAVKGFTRTTLDHQAGISLIWARRWW